MASAGHWGALLAVHLAGITRPCSCFLFDSLRRGRLAACYFLASACIDLPRPKFFRPSIEADLSGPGTNHQRGLHISDEGHQPQLGQHGQEGPMRACTEGQSLRS